ncbi:MAG TPA: DMT family transporter [Gaiellaceae bacterium]|nr:DMT family transporter [Gaiellaceae bacterium]
MAVLLALASGFLFGAMTVALRFALRRAPGAELGTLATVASALAVALVALGISGESFHGGNLGWFVLGGALAPTASQLLFTFAVREVGPSRTSVLVGTAPLFAVVIALVALGEPVRLPLIAGGLLIVCGGILLVAERGRPEHLRPVGLVLAAASAAAIASRDNIARWVLNGTTVPTLAGLVVTLATGTVLTLLWLLAARGRRGLHVRGALPYVPVGAVFGLSYVCLFEAYAHGRVSVVSPVVATESLWAVGLSALLLRQHELVGRRLALGAVTVVAGSVLIGAFR